MQRVARMIAVQTETAREAYFRNAESRPVSPNKRYLYPCLQLFPSIARIILSQKWPFLAIIYCVPSRHKCRPKFSGISHGRSTLQQSALHKTPASLLVCCSSKTRYSNSSSIHSSPLGILQYLQKLHLSMSSEYPS